MSPTSEDMVSNTPDCCEKSVLNEILKLAYESSLGGHLGKHSIGFKVDTVWQNFARFGTFHPETNIF